MQTFNCVFNFYISAVSRSMAGAVVGAGLFAYVYIYRLHTWWMKFWTNIDHEKIRPRIMVRYETLYRKCT